MIAEVVGQISPKMIAGTVIGVIGAAIATYWEIAKASEAGPRASGPARRVASRTVFADEVLWALGPEVRERVVGLSPMADDPRYSTVAGLWPSTTPRLGRNPEELLALGPDLVILASFSEVEYRAAIEGKVFPGLDMGSDPRLIA